MVHKALNGTCLLNRLILSGHLVQAFYLFSDLDPRFIYSGKDLPLGRDQPADLKSVTYLKI